MTINTQQKKLAEAGLDLDMSSWELVSFGDVAKKQNVSIDRENTDLTRYVAGEHMASEDLHLRKWGEIGEGYLGPAFTRKFEKDDILYGSRRTYLRKIAVAHFDGITANTTFVIKANEDLILKGLLPFVMLSEGFAQHSIRNSKGSVNPYVNWKDIASYEFLLPPKDQQAKLAELLWAGDGVKVAYYNQLQGNVSLRSSFISERLFPTDSLRGSCNKGWEVLRLRDLIDSLETGPCVKYLKQKSDANAPSLLKTSAVSTNRFLAGENLQVIEADRPKLKISPREDSIIISRINTAQLVGASAYINQDWPNLFLPDRLWQTVISKTDSVHCRWLSHVLTSAAVRSRIISLCAGTSNSMKYLTKESFLSIRVPVPPIAEQRRLSNEVLEIEEAIQRCTDATSSVSTIFKSLINQIF